MQIEIACLENALGIKDADKTLCHKCATQLYGPGCWVHVQSNTIICQHRIDDQYDMNGEVMNCDLCKKPFNPSKELMERKAKSIKPTITKVTFDEITADAKYKPTIIDGLLMNVGDRSLAYVDHSGVYKITLPAVKNKPSRNDNAEDPSDKNEPKKEADVYSFLKRKAL